MKEALSIQELKALCELFFNEGKSGHQSFEELFNLTMQGKYSKAIEREALQRKWYEMQAEIEKNMEQYDREDKLRAVRAIEDLRKIIITC